MTMPTTQEWAAINAALRAPFPVDDVDFRFAKAGKVAPGAEGEVLAYVDARAVQDLLDHAVGPQNWAFDWTPVSADAKGLYVVKGTLTIHGVSKSDVGDAGNIEGNKGAVSDALKRAAVLWGIGRYLYSLPTLTARAGSDGKPDAARIAAFRTRLAEKFGTPAKAA